MLLPSISNVFTRAADAIHPSTSASEECAHPPTHPRCAGTFIPHVSTVCYVPLVNQPVPSIHLPNAERRARRAKRAFCKVHSRAGEKRFPRRFSILLSHHLCDCPVHVFNDLHAAALACRCIAMV